MVPPWSGLLGPGQVRLAEPLHLAMHGWMETYSLVRSSFSL